MNTNLSLPPRLYIDVLCARLSRGRWAAHSLALPNRITGGETANIAAEKLRRLAEGIAGEPVKALVTVFSYETSGLTSSAAGEGGE